MKSKQAALLALVAWGLLLAIGLAVAPRFPAAAVTDPIRFFPDDATNRVASATLTRLFPGAVAASQVVIVLETDDPRGVLAERARVAALAATLRSAFPADAVSGVLAPTDDPVVAERLVAPDGRGALVLVQCLAGFASEQAGAIVAEVERITGEALADSTLRFALSGHATLGRDYLRAIEEGARNSALATVALVAVTLLLVYRAPVAVLASLTTLGIALGVANGAVTLAAEAGLPVAFQSHGLLVAIVYGVGTDYCLLVFGRVREERARAGADAATLADVLAHAWRESAPILVTSAAAVAVACALMGFARFGLFAYSGPALALGVAVTLAAVLTLLPALMTVAGRWIFWPRAHASAGRLWPAIARLVIGRPIATITAFFALVAPLAAHGLHVAPSFELELDIPAQSASEAGWEALVRHFDPAQVQTLTLAVELGPIGETFHSGAGLDAIHQLSEWLATQPGIARVWSATRPTGEAGLFARATLRSQLAELSSGLGRAALGAGQLASGLAGAKREVEAGRRELAQKEAALADEQRRSLLGAFAPGRFEGARRDLEGFDEKLAGLERGLGEAEGGAHALADGVERGRARLDAIEGEPNALRLLDRIALTPEDVASSPEIGRALGYYLSTDARAARFELVLGAPPNSPAAVATLARLRSDLAVLLPALGLPGARAFETGMTPITHDLAELTRADLERLDLWIVLGVFAVLVVLLRSVAAPLAITGFILLSYFAALGALRLLVTWGAWPGLDWKAPFFLFVLLVAFGADYGVFLLGRAREEARHTAFAPALARALEATGPVVTSCGLVLAGTFATLGLSRIAFLEQVGIGITVGVLVDTGIVRPFLLPAAALLLAGARARPQGGS